MLGLKVCFVYEHFYPHIGGAETLSLRMAEKLVSAGFRVRVITSDTGGVKGKNTVNGVEVFHYPWKSLFGHPIPSPVDLEKHIKWADVVHTATYSAAPTTLKVAKKHNKPCVLTVYEYLGLKWYWVDSFIRASLFVLYEFWVVHKSYSHYFAISQATKKDMVTYGVAKNRIHVVYPFLEKTESEASKKSNKNLNNKYFLYYGRPGKTKGIFVLLKAIKKLKKNLIEGYKFIFILSNDPLSERQKFVQKINMWGLNDIVEVLPSQEKDTLKQYVSGALAVIIPSITEGFGFTTVESCQLGTNVIVSSGGSLPEVSFGKVLLFKNRNSLDLAEKIILATKNEFQEKRVTLENNEEILSQIKRLYSDIVK